MHHDSIAEHRLEPIIAAAFRPLVSMRGSKWADTYRYLPSEESEGGKYSTARTPYLREILDVLSPSDPTEDVVLMKCAQIGATEAGNNFLGMCMHMEPGRIIQVQPTVELAKRHSRTRIEPLIEKTPVLRGLVKPARSRDSSNTVLSKKFPGGIFVLTGANSAVGLESIAARYAMLDEIDGYPYEVSNKGEPTRLVIQRTITFRGKRKIFQLSTPTDELTSRIEPAYLASDQRRYFCPCPFCDHMQHLEWAQLRWPPTQPWEAQYECIVCQALWGENQKTDIVAQGEWRATVRERREDGELVIRLRTKSEYAPGMAAGFHINALVSPWVTWGEMAAEFLKTKDDPVTLKTFVNLKLAETWKTEASLMVYNTGLMARCEDYGADVPDGVIVVTAGVDIQDDRIEVETVGWGEGEEAWSLGHEILWGDPSAKDTWSMLDDYLLAPLYDGHGQPYYIQATCVDTGGHHTLQAYNFVRPRSRRRVWGIKGRDGTHPLWPREPSRNNKGKIDLYLIGVDAAKEAIYSRLPHKPPGPGRMHFPVGCTQRYFDQLTAEVQNARRSKGHIIYEWINPKQRPNEVLDTWVYAMAALYGLRALGYRYQPMRRPLARAAVPAPADAETPEEAAQVRVPRQPTARRRVRRSNYLGR